MYLGTIQNKKLSAITREDVKAIQRKTTKKSPAQADRAVAVASAVFAFALDQIPVALQWVSYLFPARFMVSISRGVFLKGADFAQLWPELAALAGYALVMLVVASALYGRRSAR